MKFLQNIIIPLSLTLSTTVYAAEFGTERNNYNDIVTVEVIHHQNKVVLGGTVVPERQVTISAQLPGHIEYLAGAEGDGFDENTVLLSIDDDELLAKRRETLAAISNAEVAMRNAGMQFNRELISPQSKQTMSGMGVPGMFDQMFFRNFTDMMGTGGDTGMDRHADLYTRSSGIEQARNSYLQAKSQLEQIDAKIRDAVGKAPFNGVIIEKLAEVGDTVQPGQPLLKFADTDVLQILIDVPARLMPGIKHDDILQARLDVRDTIIKARVSQIYPMADPVRHTVSVKLDLPVNAPAAPGMYVEVNVLDVSSPPQTMLAIPKSALVQRGSLPAVYVLNPQGKKEMRVIRRGPEIDNGRIAILSGLLGGERVINNPTGTVVRK